MILACANCGDVASEKHIRNLVDTKDKQLLTHECGGLYRLMEKAEAADIMMFNQLTVHKLLGEPDAKYRG